MTIDEQLRLDRLLFGSSFEKVNDNGERERIDPRLVKIDYLKKYNEVASEEQVNRNYNWTLEESVFKNLITIRDAKRHELIQKDQIRYYRHKSRGKYYNEFKKELLGAIESGKGEDCYWGDEDFDSGRAMKAVMRLLNEKGLLKFIK